MKLNIKYTDGFETFQTEIGNNDEVESLKKELSILEDKYNSLIEDISEIKELLSSKDTSKREFTGHISTYKHYDNYKITRLYDIENKEFYTPQGKGKIKLDFNQLVSIIKSHKNGLTPQQMKVNPILSGFSNHSIQHYIYIWRAGGFNQAIKESARELGFNPKKLISKEVE